MSYLICPKTELDLAFMVTSTFDDDSIKNEQPSMELTIPHKSMEIFSSSKGKNFQVSSLIWPENKFVQAFMPLLVTGNFDDESIKNEWHSIETPFSHYRFFHYKSMGIFLKAQWQLTL